MSARSIRLRVVDAGPLRARWSMDLPGHGGHRVMCDPDLGTIWASDGWGIAFAATKLRAIDMSDGSERATFRPGNGIRCLRRESNGTTIIAASDTRLFRLRIADLERQAVWDRRIPRYPDSIAVVDDHAVVANWRAPSLGIVDLAAGGIRRRVLGSMMVIVQRSDDVLVACRNGSGVSHIDPVRGVIRPAFDTPPIIDIASGPEGDLWVLTKASGDRWSLGRVIGMGHAGVELRRYDESGEVTRLLHLPMAADRICPGRTAVALHDGRRVLIHRDEASVAFAAVVPEGYRVMCLDADKGSAFAVRDMREGPATLTRFDLDPDRSPAA